MDLWIIGRYHEGTDKIGMWQDLLTFLNEYLRIANTRSEGYHLPNIGEIKGEFFWEGSTSGDSELGVEYQGVDIKITCYTPIT